MKKNLILLCIALLGGAINAAAQTACPGCTVNLPPLPADTIYATPVPNGQQGVYYDQTVSFRLPKTTTPLCNIGTNPPPCGLTIDKFKIISITGLPLGLDWTPNVANGTYIPATNPDGCIRLCGTPLQADTFQVNVFVEATVFGTANNSSVPLQFVVNPSVSATAGFTMSNATGCAPVSVSFTNNVPSNGHSGYSYNWAFGNGNLSIQETPPAQTYPAAGSFSD